MDSFAIKAMKKIMAIIAIISAGKGGYSLCSGGRGLIGTPLRVENVPCVDRLGVPAQLCNITLYLLGSFIMAEQSV